MKLLFLIGVFFAIASCNSDDEVSEQECPNDLICTQEFRILTVRIEDANGQSVLLDSYEMTNIETGENLAFVEPATPEGQYIIADDSHVDIVERSGTAFQFQGVMNGEVVVDQAFSIGHDCCHISLVEGPEIIQLP